MGTSERTEKNATVEKNIHDELQELLRIHKRYETRYELLLLTIEKFKRNINKEHWNYLLTVTCKRAYLLGINRNDMLNVSKKLFDYCKLHGAYSYDLEVAQKEYVKCDWITDKEIEEVTKIRMSSNCKRYEKLRDKRSNKIEKHRQRITALKRYVKKGYSVTQILKHLKAANLGISKTVLYTNKEYYGIITGIFNNEDGVYISERHLPLLVWMWWVKAKYGLDYADLINSLTKPPPIPSKSKFIIRKKPA